MLLLLGSVFLLGWAAFLIYACVSLRKIGKFAPGANAGRDLPGRLSILIAVKDDEREIEETLKTLCQLRFPDLELIVVVDRSTDNTESIVRGLAKLDARIRPVIVTELPSGWLGKVHALEQGSRVATGEFLLFMDADMATGEGVIAEALWLAQEKSLDHLSIVPRITAKGFWHDLMMYTSNVLFLSSYRPWLSIEDRPLKCVKGMGKFNLVRRSALARSDGFQWLKMDVADDVALAQLIARSGGPSLMLLSGPEGPELSWYEDFRGIVLGLEKNIVGGFTNYHLGLMALMVSVASLPLLASVLLVSLGGASAALGLGAWALTVLFALSISRELPYSVPLMCCLPLGQFLLALILLRSTVICYRQGGIRWSGTLYKLDELRRGVRVRMGL